MCPRPSWPSRVGDPSDGMTTQGTLRLPLCSEACFGASTLREVHVRHSVERIQAFLLRRRRGRAQAEDDPSCPLFCLAVFWFEQDMKVVVVGGGLAGLAASIEAFRAGAKVVLLEKNPKMGGNSAKATSGGAPPFPLRTCLPPRRRTHPEGFAAFLYSTAAVRFGSIRFGSYEHKRMRPKGSGLKT